MKFILALLFPALCFAQARRAPVSVEDQPTRLTYDLSAATGTYDGSSYTEIDVGLNWFLRDWLNWRNAIFSRQGANLDSVQGLDSSFRFIKAVQNERGSLGFDAFIGPGARIATRDYDGVFAEAGLIFHLGGLRIGAGFKEINYVKDRRDSAGNLLSRNDSQFFLILGGGGAL